MRGAGPCRADARGRRQGGTLGHRRNRHRERRPTVTATPLDGSGGNAFTRWSISPCRPVTWLKTPVALIACTGSSIARVETPCTPASRIMATGAISTARRGSTKDRSRRPVPGFETRGSTFPPPVCRSRLREPVPCASRSTRFSQWPAPLFTPISHPISRSAAQPIIARSGSACALLSLGAQVHHRLDHRGHPSVQVGSRRPTSPIPGDRPRYTTLGMIRGSRTATRPARSEPPWACAEPSGGSRRPHGDPCPGGVRCTAAVTRRVPRTRIRARGPALADRCRGGTCRHAEPAAHRDHPRRRGLRPRLRIAGGGGAVAKADAASLCETGPGRLGQRAAVHGIMGSALEDDGPPPRRPAAARALSRTGASSCAAAASCVLPDVQSGVGAAGFRRLSWRGRGPAAGRADGGRAG